jgi:pimeloyl-ACP methyl ester carboxylesterase
MADRIPLVLLPGLLNDAALWSHQVATLADVAEITVRDLTRFDDLRGAARALLDELPDTFALAGLSMGGYLAQEIMRHAPERVARLALVDTSARADTPEQGERRRGYIALAQQGDFKGITDRLLPSLVHERSLQRPEVAQTLKDMADRVGRDAFIRQQTMIMNRPDSRRDLGSIHCPTLVLCGREDALTPPALHAEMAAAIRRASLVVIEDSGHLTPLEQPQAVSAVFRYWLQASFA